MSKGYTSSMSCLAPGVSFPVDEAIRVRIDPVENSVLAALGSTHGQESNTGIVKFQYYLVLYLRMKSLISEFHR